MRIVFFHLQREFDGDSLSKIPMGGTETALIGLSRALAKNPENEVSIFTSRADSQTYDQVHYHPDKKFAAWAKDKEIDVLVSLRDFLPFWLPARVKCKAYLTPDAYQFHSLHRHALSIQANINQQNVTLPLWAPQTFFKDMDLFLALGQWHAQSFIEQMKVPKDKVIYTGNGVFLENFNPLPLEKRKPHLFYSSTPHRGLDQFLRLFPAIQKEFPHFKMEVCSSMKVYGREDGPVEKEFKTVYELIKKSGSLYHGSLLQKELAEKMSQAYSLSYPNTYDETFCITALEAQAAGLPVITSARAALLERIEDGVDGFLIKGNPGDPDYDKAYLEAHRQLITNPELWQKMSAAGLKKAKNFSYDKVAHKLEDDLKNVLKEKRTYECAQPQFKNCDYQLPQLGNQRVTLDAKMQAQCLKQAMERFGYG